VTRNQRLNRLARRVIYGPGGAESIVTELDKLLFMRRFLALSAIPLLTSVVLGLVVGAPTWLWIVLGVGGADGLTSAVKLPFEISRERRRTDGSSGG